MLLHCALMWVGFSAQYAEDAVGKATAPAKKKVAQSKLKAAASEKRGFVFGWIGKIYMFGFLVVEIWGQFLHPYLLGEKLPFVPLMLISIYCSLGVIYSWIWQLKWIIKPT